MNVPQYHDAIQKIVNEYETTCTQALVEMKQNLIDARRAFFGEEQARYDEEHAQARQRLLSPES